ncbi:AI-2E family transporter [Aristophania vespae]|uniref:AI-2E family transporter n=1 Tax=Aristophania vespae TaxID=2697033 RepID=A0A6P1NGS8_9PROT|nr:AI-2E family transporter [Aristophania vespae]QHI95714.1 AI-2E family transporter [Aristophania vespae]UMM63406.1 Putative transport protein YdiK [Aristophania vespae]
MSNPSCPIPQKEEEIPTPPIRIQRRARGILALFFVIAGLYTIKNFLPALLWGGVFAISLWPLYHKVERKFGTSTWLPLIFTSLLALIFLIPVTFIGYKIIDEMHSALQWIENVRHTGLPVPSWVDELPFGSGQIHNWWQNNLSQSEKIQDFLHSLDLGHSVQVTRQVGSQLAHRSILFVFSLLTLFFLLKDGEVIIKKCLKASHRLFGSQGESLAAQVVSSVHGTLSGLVLVGLGEGAVMGVAYVVADAPQPLIFGFVTAICAMIPFLGWVAVTLVSLLIAAKGSMIAAIVVWVVGAIVLFLADHFVRPVLIGGSTKMPFLWVLLGILGGAEIWGLLGLFLGPAIMASLHLFWSLWTEGATRENVGRKLHR